MSWGCAAAYHAAVEAHFTRAALSSLAVGLHFHAVATRLLQQVGAGLDDAAASTCELDRHLVAHRAVLRLPLVLLDVLRRVLARQPGRVVGPGGRERLVVLEALREPRRELVEQSECGRTRPPRSEGGRAGQAGGAEQCGQPHSVRQSGTGIARDCDSRSRPDRPRDAWDTPRTHAGIHGGMKLKVLSRDKRDFTRGSSSELTPVARSLQPELHPFDRAREYKRALNAVKLDRHFAKPFVCSLSGHLDSVNCLAKSAGSLSTLVSGSCDGEIRRWNLTEPASAWCAPAAHKGFVRGLAFSRSGHHFLSASEDQTVKLWSSTAAANQRKPLSRYLGKGAFNDVDHHHADHLFATAGAALVLWDVSRSEPMQTFSWGADGLTRVRFNPAQHNLLGTISTDRAVVLYDTSTGSALQKMTMQAQERSGARTDGVRWGWRGRGRQRDALRLERSSRAQTRPNGMCWNPMEPMHFTLPCEDHDLYTFDLRKLGQALCVHRGHVSAVLDVDYAPTGRRLSVPRLPRSRSRSRPRACDDVRAPRVQAIRIGVVRQDDPSVGRQRDRRARRVPHEADAAALVRPMVDGLGLHLLRL